MQTRYPSDDLSHRHLSISRPQVEEFVGMRVLLTSAAIQKVLGQARKIAPTRSPVLISGESGTGKELVARAIHQYSGVTGPFIDINCAAFPEHLIESELFGYEKGAFSGADSQKPGIFETAQHGTLFLDEIGELEPRMQAKLLRVLDGQPYFRLGGNRKVQPEARIVAATNLPLKASMENGRFRADLYHRLDAFSLDVPPLRDRTADIEPLSLFFLEASGLGISGEAVALLEKWNWPGNVRELRNVLNKAALFAQGPLIVARDLPPEIRAGFVAAPASQYCLELLERRTILKALEVSRGHQQHAANLLGISRRTLIRKLKTYREMADLPQTLADETAEELVA